MQLFALDIQKRLISANHASKGLNYNCFECGSVVRLRGGIHRQNHFYHLKPDRSCYLSGKSLTHIQVQMTLERSFPPGESLLEKRFPSINRIADVVWEPQKLIFEVQCSGITAQEVKDRNRDYATLGYEVVWILHDNRFNQRRITAAEMFLRHSPHYYTNINSAGKGIIYDQFDLIEKGVRCERLIPLKVDLGKPFIPKAMLSPRRKEWPIAFFGDLLSLKSTDPYLIEAANLEAKYSKEERKDFRTLLNKYIVRPYFILFHILLERVCK